MTRRGEQLGEAIREAQALVRKGHEDGELDIGSKNFDRLAIELPEIMLAHAAMQATLTQYPSALPPILVARPDAALRQLTDILDRPSRERASISKEIADIGALLEKVTLESAEQALGLEARAARLTWGITIGAIIVGLWLAGLITRSLVRPVRDLVAGTQAVREGNLAINVKVSTSDEIATLADSFNHMIGGLRQKEVIQNTFGKYVDPRIVKRLIENDGLPQASKRKRMTVFFSDIEGFTSLSEKIPPDRLVAFLNRYFAQMADVVREEHGIIDKTIGDAIMAFWRGLSPEHDFK